MRAFRLLRVFKLAKSWQSLQNLLRTISETLKDIRSFSILLLLYLYSYTLIGCERFSYKARFNDNSVLDYEDPDA